MTRFVTASDGAKLAYTVQGDGPALICLSGLTRNGSDFSYVLPHLTDVTAITMDYRGRGASDWTGAGTYTIQRESQDVLDLMDHLGLEKSALLGTSRGGLISMALAATAKDRLAGVMLNDIGPEIDMAGLKDIAIYIGRNPASKTLAEVEDALASRLPGFTDVPDGRWAEEARKHYIETPEGLSINYDPALRDAFMASFDPDAPPADLWPLFDAMEGLPLAAVRGANSNLLSAETFAKMKQRRPDMMAATVPGRGHVPFLDEPEALEVVEWFLEKIA